MKTKPSPNSKLLTCFILIFSTLLIYASLMPFDFVTGIKLKKILQEDLWNQWPFSLKAPVSRSDILINLVIYFPLGFLVAVKGAELQISRYRNLFLCVLLCSLLSFSVELLQSMIIQRTPSATDWSLNSISALGGAWVGTVSGLLLVNRSILWLKTRWRNAPLDFFTLMILMLLIADALAPFLPVIRLSQITSSLEHAFFNPFAGIDLYPWHWWLVVRILPILTFCLLLGFWNGQLPSERRWRKAVRLGLLCVLGLEGLKLMVVTNQANLANVLTGGSGALIVVFLGPAAVKFSRRAALNTAILIMTGYILYLAWTPFIFAWDIDSAMARLPERGVANLPFYHYVMASTLGHVRLLVQNVLLSGSLVYLLRLRFSQSEGLSGKVCLAIFIGLTIGILQEGGQLFIPSRTPSLSDIYCFILGGLCAITLPRHHKLGYD